MTGSLTCMLGSDSDDAAETVMPFLDTFAKKALMMRAAVLL